MKNWESSEVADHYFWCSGVFLAVSRLFWGIMGCSRGVPGLFRGIPGCSGGVPGMFRGVPGVFRGVPGCSGFYRHPLSILLLIANSQRASRMNGHLMKIASFTCAFLSLIG